MATSLAPTVPPQGTQVLTGLTTASVVGSAAATFSNVSRVAPDGTVMNGIRMQATGSTNCSVDFNFSSNTFSTGRLALLVYADPGATSTDINGTWFLADSGSFTNYFQVTGLVQNFKDWNVFNPATSGTSSPSKWAVGGGTPVFGSTSSTRMRFRMDYSNGQLPWIEIYELTYNEDVPQSWMSIVIDDGFLDDELNAPSWDDDPDGYQNTSLNNPSDDNRIGSRKNYG